MDTQSSLLWLHQYSGRENGLMIVGDRSALEVLGRQRTSAVPLDERRAPGWPLAVARPSVVGPVKGAKFALSFHLKGDLPLENVLPLRSRYLKSVLLLIAAICTIIGAITIASTIARGL
jgi:hypothetical protein